ncbi:MAG TPA: response regulator [Calditrichaeota bacterium]|nr:response regulator [Calditrichota bacterium]
MSLDIAEEEEKEEDIEKLELDFEAEALTSEPKEEKPAKEVPEDKETGEAKKTILVIDDSIVIRKMVEIALEDEKEIRVETAVKGKDGLEIMDKIQPDLVIIDLMLPDIGGIELLKTIKASRGIPVIMLSGKDSPQMIENARNEGADAFLPKPFKDDELVEKIKSLLQI